MTQAVIDRFEGEWVILEVDGQQRTLPRTAVPQDAREGEVVDLDTGQVDPAATERLREQVRQARARAAQTAKKPPGGFDL
jgi:hypothetical protein